MWGVEEARSIGAAAQRTAGRAESRFRSRLRISGRFAFSVRALSRATDDPKGRQLQALSRFASHPASENRERAEAPEEIV
jgi:hypothetical protein